MQPFPWKTFTPHFLPPQHVSWKSFQRELTRAHQALALYQHPVSSLALAREAIDSLYPIRVSPQRFLHSPRLKKYAPILHYQQALKNALCRTKHRPITKALLCRLHAKIKQGELPANKLGTYRQEPNWIGPEGKGPEEAYYFPPSEKLIPSLMNNLISYTNSQEKDPLVHIAIIIAQLLIIHPYIDGNGRVARMLIPILLIQHGFPPLFLSTYFKRHRLKYFHRLYAITSERAWEEWILFFLKGISSTIKNPEK